jgi:predicted nucleic acid-binding protein
VNAVADTTILIDFLNGSRSARNELARFEEITISLITWMEVLIGARDTEEESEIRKFLNRFRVHPVDSGVAERAVDIRRGRRLRLPDAIIWATAQQLGLILITRNTKDFPKGDPGVRVPYTR